MESLVLEKIANDAAHTIIVYIYFFFAHDHDLYICTRIQGFTFHSGRLRLRLSNEQCS